MGTIRSPVRHVSAIQARLMAVKVGDDASMLDAYVRLQIDDPKTVGLFRSVSFSSVPMVSLRNLFTIHCQCPTPQMCLHYRSIALPDTTKLTNLDIAFFVYLFIDKYTVKISQRFLYSNYISVSREEFFLSITRAIYDTVCYQNTLDIATEPKGSEQEDSSDK
jgi:hypothetical protein